MDYDLSEEFPTLPPHTDEDEFIYRSEFTIILQLLALVQHNLRPDVALLLQMKSICFQVWLDWIEDEIPFPILSSYAELLKNANNALDRIKSTIRELQQQLSEIQVEPVIEPAIQAVEPASVPAIQSVAEPIAEPASEPTNEPAPETSTEDCAEQPVAESEPAPEDPPQLSRWLDDSEVSNCMICNKKFNFFNRRHV